MVAVPFVGAILIAVCVVALRDNIAPDFGPVTAPPVQMSFGIALSSLVGGNLLTVAAMPDLSRRSEEHTSELQSLMRISYAVFCLKKKKIKNTRLYITTHYHSHP